MNENQAKDGSEEKDIDVESVVNNELKTQPESEHNGLGCGLKLFLISIVMLSIVAGLLWYASVEARRIPDFYAKVLKTDDKKAEADGRLFERNLVQLQNTARRRHPWKIEITQDQVNGWFKSDLPEKFPESLPADIKDPRVVFSQDGIRLAFKYSVRGVAGIVVISADVFCTENPNEIAVKINDVRTGVIPLPIGPWLEKVADGIRNAGIPVFWSKTGDAPLAIFTLPDYVTSNTSQSVVVEAIDLKPEKLVIAGKSIRVNEPEKNKLPEKNAPTPEPKK